MPIPSIYLNLEDDVSKIVQRVKREKSPTVVLVCPKRCFLFADSINLRLLKKQTDLLEKEVYILTMDEIGQIYAKEAGFKLKFLPKSGGRAGAMDIRPSQPPIKPQTLPAKSVSKPKPSSITNKVAESVAAGLKNLVHKTPPTIESNVELERPEVTENYYPTGPAQFDTDIVKARNRRRSYKRFSLGFIAVCFLLVIVLVFAVLPKASVAVYPKTEPLTRDWDLSLSSAIKQPDSANLTLPVTAVSQTFEEQKKFQTQGKKEIGNKASGTVQIYNFTKQPLNLKAATTILTLGSKNYLLTQDLTGIKPTTYKNATTKEIDTNSLTPPVQVMAQNGGEDYNLPAGTRLEITNQVFGSKPQFLFAKTVDAIAGGTSRFLSVVTDQDITAAQNSLADQAVLELKSGLATQNMVLADKSYVVEKLGFNTDKPVSTESPDFKASLKVKITGLAFSMNDLQKLIIDRINQTLSSDESISITDPAKQITYNLKTIDIINSKATMNVHFEGIGVMKVNISDISSELVGKNLKQANEILLSKKQIDKVEITLAPTWQKNFPLFASKIKVWVTK